ncbi:hypothetical protein ES288_D02G035300v1 [Gossypium darwinii]|uniref:Leucine-rich repeat-containing N-terminal plant-type domain-containing protein n=1 Tax=Gossypium darwinii TaxID=34276 RepID=A0A5D2DCL0_GOSDA|nr:hypothetical protein ES288_D02G035300v1 [Gossypium darwinii]
MMMEWKWLWFIRMAVLLLVLEGCRWCTTDACLEHERIALLHLKPFFNYGNPLKSWVDLKGSDCCKWERVKCNSITRRKLKSLYLSENAIGGNLENEGFGKLSSTLSNLEILYLSYNHLNDSILLSLSELSSLRYLDLSHNRFEGSSHPRGFQWLSRLTKLETLNLSGNSWKNSILFNMRNLSSLKTLRLSSNQLEGRLLHIQELNNLTDLNYLDLSGNRIESISNKGLSNLINLKKLDLSENQIESLQSSKDGGRKLELTHLKELNLNSNLFNNSVFASLNKLLNLKTLTISNQLKGPIDAKGWCDLRNLEVLDVSGNALEGMLPHCFSNLTALRVLDISRNHFQIPLSFAPFANLSNIKALLSNENKMVTEPSFYTSIPKFQLEVISLSKCITSQQLSRKLPTFLYYQYDLRYVDLSHNNFSGTVPTWLLENNTKLEDLILKGNSFTGPLSFSSALISNVSSIDISENKIQGQIPTSICSTFPHLSRLFLSKNAFEGNIPLCLSGMKDLSILDLSNNQLYGKVPEELITKGSLTILRLSNNNFSGNVVPAILKANGLQNLYLDGNKFSGEVTNFDVSTFEFPNSLSDIDLSNNQLHGKLPRWIGNASFLLRLALSNNGFEGSIPMEFCNLNWLEFLDLSQNNLSGSIPSCFNPPNIKHVHLHGNRLRGPLSLAFYNSSSLVTLDLREKNLTGSMPKWIDTLSSLSVLLLKDNHFHGKVPIQLCKLYSLSIIDLSQNMFSGPIPSCLGNLSLPMKEKEKVIEFTTKSGFYSYEGNILAYMTGIDLSCNNLTGHIPPELGNLSEIYSLNLSHNKLIGVIPSSFSKLHQIESLDLSYNNLSGEIPNQLVELNSLEVFSVAHNNLSGSIPEPKAQFGTFIESSYEGNPFLCGTILHKSCSKPDAPSTRSNSLDDEGEDSLLDTYDFCVSFLVSYIVVVLTIFVVLYINPYWRSVWFSFIGKCITTCRYSTMANFLTYHIFRQCD